MKVCYSHSLAYEDRYCPACLIQDDLDAANEEIEKLNRIVQELEENKK